MYTLITPPGDAKAFKILIAAEFVGVSIDVPTFSPQDIKSPLNRTPYLTSLAGSLYSSAAITRFIAGQNRAAALWGPLNSDKAFVDAWVEFAYHELEIPAAVWVAPLLGLGMEGDSRAVEQARVDIEARLAVLEKQLKKNGSGYLVGKSLTLADIVCVSTLIYPFKFVCEPAYLKPFPNVLKWFTSCVEMPQFKNVVGTVTMCSLEMKPGDSALPAPPPKAIKNSAAGGQTAKAKNTKGLTVSTAPEEAKAADKGGSAAGMGAAIKIKELEVTDKEFASCCVIN